MHDSYLRRSDFEEIKSHIDRGFEALKRDIEWKARQERSRIEERRSRIYIVLSGVIILSGSTYNNWDFWSSLLAG